MQQQTQQQQNQQEPEFLTRLYSKVQKLGEGTYGKNKRKKDFLKDFCFLLCVFFFGLF